MRSRRLSRAAVTRATARAKSATLVGVDSDSAFILEIDRDRDEFRRMTPSSPLAFVNCGVHVLRVALDVPIAGQPPEIALEVWARPISALGSFEILGPPACLPLHLAAELGAALRRVRALPQRAGERQVGGPPREDSPAAPSCFLPTERVDPARTPRGSR